MSTGGIDISEEIQPSQKVSVAISRERLPPVPVAAREVWNAYARRYGEEKPKGYYGLRWALAGYTYSEAASKAGCSSSSLGTTARIHGFRPFIGTTKEIIDQHRTIAHVSNSELQKRLDTNPDDFSNKDLTLSGAISTDKVTNYEKTQAEGQSAFVEAIDAVADRIAKNGYELKLTISPHAPDQAADPVAEAIEVEEVAP